MFTRLLDRLRGVPPDRPLPQADARHLLGALMIRVAQADATLRVEELREMDRLLGAMFGLGPVEAARLRAESERLAQALPAMAELGPMLRAALPPAHRADLRAALRRVAEADGDWDPREAQVIEAVSALLHPRP